MGREITLEVKAGGEGAGGAAAKERLARGSAECGVDRMKFLGPLSPTCGHSRWPRDNQKRGRAAAQDVHASPSSYKLKVSYRPEDFLPGFGLRTAKVSAFKLVCEVVGNQAFVRCVVFFCAHRHLIRQAHDTGAVEGNAQNVRVVIRQDENGSYAIRFPLKRDQVTVDCPKSNSNIYRFIGRHESILACLANVRNPTTSGRTAYAHKLPFVSALNPVPANGSC